MSARAGVVYLVGAGPGDPGLMTARSLELIAAADSIYYDRLIPTGALDGARADAELIYVGKQPGVPSVPQDEIGERLIEAAKAGRSVVRLKGGDPFVFGRGGEEGEALRAAGVEFEVVPGITAGVAATAYAASRSPTATTPPRSPSSPATRTRRRPRRRSTGRRSPRSPARSSSTWGSNGWARTRRR